MVYGPNETGKSTLASFIRGVLFGWERAHGVRNTYQPDSKGREGELVWRPASDLDSYGNGVSTPAAPTPTASESAAPTLAASVPLAADPTPAVPPATALAPTASRSDNRAPRQARQTQVLVRTEGGATGATFVADDIDIETFDAIFSLSASELGSLRISPDVAARLLQAGTGTAADPSSAFVEVERRIASTPVYELSAQLEAKQDEVKAAVNQERLRVQEDRELRELRASRASASERVADLDDELDALMAARGELASADNRAQRLAEELEHMRGELSAISDSPGEPSAINPRLLALDSAEERVLRDRLDELAEAQGKVEHAVDVAKENSATSAAAYEALCELNEEEVAAQGRLRSRPGQASLAVLLPIAFIVSGIPLFVHGREINSLSITALGVSLVFVAIVLAVAAFVALFRQPQGAEQLEVRRKDAQWVMLQDRKKLDACLAERERLVLSVESVLAEVGLEQAGGSLRQARSLLDEAGIVRARHAEEVQRASSLAMRIGAAEKELAELEASRERIAREAGVPLPVQGALGVESTTAEVPKAQAAADSSAALAEKGLAAAIDAAIRERTHERDALREAMGSMSERLGELSGELEFARTDRSTDRLKLEYHQIRTQLREAKEELIALLLARRMLERSIALWNSSAQPEVYARAGELLERITGGQWVGVATSSTGSLVAIRSDGVEREPRHLSLGTCQQLYLVMRVALLTTVENVGRSVPVLADDVLVNFDAERRRGAAAVLAELARRRQVIVFTCHRETVEALQSAAPDVTLVAL